MKNKSLLFFTLSAAIVPWVSISAEPESQASHKASSKEPDRAELKLSYDSLKQLIDDLKTKETVSKPTPPVEAIVRTASYNLSLISEKSAKVTATFSLTTFVEGWVSLPLLSSRYAVQSIEPASAVLTPKDGNLVYLTQGAGEHQLTATFLIAALPDGSFTLNTNPATSGKLQTTDLAGYIIQGAEKFTANTFILPLEGGSIRISPTRTQEVKKSSWVADSKVLHIAADSELQAQAQIQLIAKQGDTGTTAHMLLPKNARIIEVTGPDLSSWKETRSGSQQLIHFSWKTHGINRRRVTLFYSLPLLDPEETWTLSIPKLENDQPTRGLLGIVTPSEFQLTPTEKITRLDSSFAPDWMKRHGRPLILKLPKARPINFTGKRLAQIQAATATIKSAVFKTQIVTDGSTLSEGAIEITHRDPDLWTFQLPKNTKMLTCSIDGVQTNPIILNDGSLQLSLPAKQSQKEANAKNSTTKVSISFTSKLEKMKPIEGKLSLELPSTPLFIHELQWIIALPHPYEATALDGNLTFSTNRTGGKSKQHISLIKRLCRNQAAQTDIFYRKQEN